MRIVHVFAVAAIAGAIPAIAQAQSSTAQPSTDVTQPPGDTGPASDAAAANNSTLATAAAQPAATIRREDQAAYDADMAAYLTALRANQRDASYDAAIAAHRERAYADAMLAWRIQVADCHRGVSRACKAPSPRPSDFW